MSNELKKKLELMLSKINDYEKIQIAKNPISTKVSDSTVKEIRLFTQYAQLFLEKEFDIIDLLDKLAIKVIGKSLRESEKVIQEVDNFAHIKLPFSDANSSMNTGTVDGITSTQLLLPDTPYTFTPYTLTTDPNSMAKSFSNKLVTVICCENIEGNNNPKLKKLGPYFKARVLEELSDKVKVQITETGFDPYVFIIPKEDIELTP